MNERFDASKVQWSEDEDDAIATGESDEFADMMASSDVSADVSAIEEDFSIGDKVTGTIAELRQKGDVLIDLGGKVTGMIAREELAEQLQVGDKVTAVVIEVNGNEVLLSIRRAAEMRTVDQLHEALRAKMPVKGRVVGTNKGGFEVKIGGQKAFCPVSQMDAHFIHDKSKYMNRDFEFLVQKISGRDVLVSRQAALAIEQEQQIQKIIENFAAVKDTVLDGKVVELKDFGAFVDIGGLTGMVHISELAHGRVDRVADVVSVGDSVRVKLLKIEEEGSRRKVSLSMKSALQDPWDDVASICKAGDSLRGQVIRLADFGAFVEIKPGLDGVVHISEMSWIKRIKHPSDILQTGQVIDVRVLDVDASRRRISLSMKSIEDDPWFKVKEDMPVGSEHMATVERLKNFGAIVEIKPGITALLPMGVLKQAFGDSYKKQAQPGKELTVSIGEIDLTSKKIRVNIPGVETDDDGNADFKEYERQQDAQNRVDEAPKAMGTLGELLQASLNKKK